VGQKFAPVGGSKSLLYFANKPLVIVHKAFYGFLRKRLGIFGLVQQRGG
jgi:hypothetical protein